MGLGHGTSTVRNGLVFHYDMENSAKSWKGKPTTNLTTDTVSQNGWSGSYTLINSATKTFDVQITQPNAATTSAWRSHYWDVSSHIGSTVTISMDVEIKSITDCDFSRTAVGQGNTGSFPFHIAGSDAADKMQLESLPGKTHFTWTGVINATGIVGISTWITNVQANGANVVLRISNVQIEVNGFETPFVNGTRSNTEALIDLTKNHTIDLASINYLSDNTFRFTSNSHNITVDSNGFYISGPKTLSIWIRSDRPLSVSDNWEVGFLNQGSTQGSMFGFMYGVGNCQDLGFWGYGAAYDMSVESTTNKWSSDGNWHNGVLTMDGSRNVRVYIDGEAKQWLKHSDYSTKVDYVTMPIDTTNYFLINSRNVWNSGMSYVDLGDVMVYDRALSEAEVKQNFNATRGRYGI